MALKYEVNVNSSRKPDLQPRICSHMNYVASSPDVQRALIYLKLTRESCERSKAMCFASKNVCMSDSTKLTDGPVVKGQDRRLKVRKGVSNTTLSIKGWLNNGLDYDLGSEFTNEAVYANQFSGSDMEKAAKILSRELPQKLFFQKRLENINNHLGESINRYSFSTSNIANIPAKVA